MTVRWITAFIDHPATIADSEVRFWQVVTGSALSTRRGARGQFATLVPTDGDPYLRVQETDDGSAQVHLDLQVNDVEAQARRAEVLGAEHVGGGDGLAVMSSPAGMTFCFVNHHGEASRPGVTEAPSGGYRFDQISVDIPFHQFDAECEFWSDLTGWRLHDGSVPEFRVFERPRVESSTGGTGAMPIRLLMQRLGEEDPGPHARAHLDAAVGLDGDAIASWHTSLGAKVLGRGRRWITLLDPAGLPYCLTERDPMTGELLSG